jgi:hypothetical protein
MPSKPVVAGSNPAGRTIENTRFSWRRSYAVLTRVLTRVLTFAVRSDSIIGGGRIHDRQEFTCKPVGRAERRFAILLHRCAYAG